MKKISLLIILTTSLITGFDKPDYTKKLKKFNIISIINYRESIPQKIKKPLQQGIYN